MGSTRNELLPFVLMSGGATTDRAREFLARFEGPTLAKPCKPADVHRAVDEALSAKAR